MALHAPQTHLGELVAQGDLQWEGAWPISGGCVYKEMPLAQ